MPIEHDDDGIIEVHCNGVVIVISTILIADKDRARAITVFISGSPLETEKEKAITPRTNAIVKF